MKFMSASTVALPFSLLGERAPRRANSTILSQAIRYSPGFPSILGPIRCTDTCKSGVIVAPRFSLMTLVGPCSNYVTQKQARSRGLATVNGNSFILLADNITKVNLGGNGRDSFHIVSNDRYGTHASV